MALKRLSLPPREVHTPRPVTLHDVRAAFARVARERWGIRAPLEVRDIKRGILYLRTTSASWRTEVLWAEQELCDAVCHLLPQLEPLRGVVVALT